MVGDTGRDEIRCGREQIVGPALEEPPRACALDDGIDPGGPERVAAGAFRRRALEERMAQEFLDEAWIRASAGRAGPIAIERRIEESPREPVQQRVRGSRIERLEFPALPEQRQVPEAPQVQDGGRFFDMREEQHVGERRERRAFAAVSDVPLAEVADDGAPGFGRDEIAVAELERGGARPLDAVVVPQRLAVARDEIEREPVSVRDGARGATECTAEIAVQQRDIAQTARCAFEDGAHAPRDVVRIRLGRVGQEFGGPEFDATIARVRSLPHDTHVDAVGRSAREHAGDVRALGDEAGFELVHRRAA